jgi:hypothetical protein
MSRIFLHELLAVVEYSTSFTTTFVSSSSDRKVPILKLESGKPLNRACEDAAAHLTQSTVLFCDTTEFACPSFCEALRIGATFYELYVVVCESVPGEYNSSLKMVLDGSRSPGVRSCKQRFPFMKRSA